MSRVDKVTLSTEYKSLLDTYNTDIVASLKTAERIVEYLDSLHPMEYTNKEMVSDIYFKSANLIVRAVGIDVTRTTEITEYEMKFYKKAINNLHKGLAFDPENKGACETFRNVCLFLAVKSTDEKKRLELLRQITYVVPGDYQLQFNIGFTCQRLNIVPECIVAYKTALSLLELRSNSGEHTTRIFRIKCLNGLGGVYYSVQNKYLAKYYFLKALELDETDPDIHNQLAVTYTEQRDIDKAVYHYNLGIKHYKKAHISSDPEGLLASIYMNMGLARSYECDFKASIECYNSALKVRPRLALAYQNKLLDLNYISHLIPDEMYVSRMHMNLNHVYDSVETECRGYTLKQPSDKLSIGFVSGDFVCHPVSYFISALLKKLNPDKYNVTCYSGKLVDLASVYPRCKWVTTRGMSKEDLYDAIQAEKTDILFDLSGHTGDNRLDVFAMKPARVQISYLGYPGTSGIKSMDYRLTDKIADGPDTQKYYSEKLVYIDGCFLNYTPTVNCKLGSQPYEENGYITFGCFNRLNKVNEEVIGAWKTILEKMPTARLIVKNREFLTERIKLKFLESFTSDMRRRVTILPFAHTHKKHLEDYNLMDISLDTFPYSGTTTSCESLYMGVPVLTLFDNKRYYHSQNVTSSILINSDLTEYVSYDLTSYLSRAVELGITQNFTKESIRKKFLNGGVCNSRKFVKSIEAILDNERFTAKKYMGPPLERPKAGDHRRWNSVDRRLTTGGTPFR